MNKKTTAQHTHTNTTYLLFFSLAKTLLLLISTQQSYSTCLILNLKICSYEWKAVLAIFPLAFNVVKYHIYCLWNLAKYYVCEFQPFLYTVFECLAVVSCCVFFCWKCTNTTHVFQRVRTLLSFACCNVSHSYLLIIAFFPRSPVFVVFFTFKLNYK